MAWTHEQMGELFPALTAQIRGSLSNLALAVRDLLPDEMREAHTEIDQKAARVDQSYYVLLRLLENISNADWLLGKRKPQRQPCEIVRLVSDICVDTVDLFQEQNRTLTFSIPPREHICFLDPEAVRTALFQLLSNALKFTPAGGWVRVELRLEGGQVLLSVSNSGEGLSKELADFFSDSGAIRLAPPPHGLGLGLPLCQAIAEAHGGILLAETGSRCRITLALPDEECLVTKDCGKPSIVEYNAGFNKTLLGLADALPASSFCLRNLD